MIFSPTKLLFAVSQLAGLVSSQKLGTPTYEFLYTVNCTLGKRWQIGDYGQGSRVVIPIVGGTFEGPRLKGTISNLGADWGLNDTKGVFFPDTRYNLQTHDGVDIYVQTTGPTQPDGRTLLRGIFQVGHADYEWLNYVVAVGILKRPTGADTGKYVIIDMWQVSFPDHDDCKYAHKVAPLVDVVMFEANTSFQTILPS